MKAAAAEVGFQLLPKPIPIKACIWCFLARPKSDFVGDRREVGNLKESALATSNTVVAMKPDTDNLAKFVLDALTGVLYQDDAQIVDLHMYKLRDSETLCNGRVAMDVSVFNQHWSIIMPDF